MLGKSSIVAALALALASAFQPAAVASTQQKYIYGYCAIADVQIPGGGVKCVRVSGVFGASSLEAAGIGAQVNARAKLSAYGTVLGNPVVTLISPFAAPQIPNGPLPDAPRK